LQTTLRGRLLSSKKLKPLTNGKNLCGKEVSRFYRAVRKLTGCPALKKGVTMKRFLNTLFKGVEILIAIFLAVMIVLVFMNVVLRQFNKGFAWSEEIARRCFIYLVYLGTIGAMRDNRHLLIESLLLRVPRVAQKIVYAIVQITIIWLMVILTQGSWGLTIQNLHDNWVATKFPTWLVYAVGVLTGVSIIIIAAANLFRMVFFKMSVEELIKAHDDVPEEAALE
jgi:TRAP-type C4-dicarboxylate transport system permease small subunit